MASAADPGARDEKEAHHVLIFRDELPQPGGTPGAGPFTGRGGMVEDTGARRDRKVVAAVRALANVGGAFGGLEEATPTQAQNAVHLKFEDLEYSIPLRSRRRLQWGPKQDESVGAARKKVMSRVSGKAGPGEFLALMGPEGSGKSLLLATLGGRVRDKQALKGRVTYNGVNYARWMRRTIGYVEQVPVLQTNLTVKETLMYAAMLRMPQETDDMDRIVRVEHVIDSLDLTQCADNVVGGDPYSGHSALVNERKRLAIGLEMVMSPMLLLLDEPTSGLDGAMALRLTRTLAAYASAGRTVVSTLKQPSGRMFELFTHLLLFADGGNPIYFGPASEAMPYFEAKGHKPTYGGSPAEYLLDLAVSEPSDASIHFGTTLKLIRAWRVYEEELKKQQAQGKVEGTAGDAAPTSDMTDGPTQNEIDDVPSNWVPKRWQTGWWFQFKVLLKRNSKAYNIYTWTVLHVVAIVSTCALLTGCLWYKRSPHTYRGIRDQAGLLFYLTMFWGLLPILSTVMTFLEDRPLLHREQESGMYHISAYYTSRTLLYSCFELLPPVLFGSIVYFMAGLNPRVESFFLFLLVLALNSFVSSSIGLAFGAIFTTPQQAIWSATVVMLIGLMVVTFLITTPPSWAGWTRWLSHSAYIYRLHLRVQYPHLNDTYACPDSKTGQCPIRQHPEIERFLSELSGGGGIEAAILLCMLVGYRTIGYLFLRWRTVPR